LRAPLLGWQEEVRNPSAVRASLSKQLFHHLEAQKFLRAGDRVGVAVSGGADSVALLLLLLELREKLGIVLSVVHFNHKLRGKASDADEKFVAKLAAKHALEFHCASADVAEKAKTERANLEDTARRARYGYFRSLAESGVCTRIAVAHTADDQAETVLAHILRGTGIAGLGGIHPLAGPVFRPLLSFRRSQLRNYLRQKKQKWCEDVTNLDTTRMRARIRKKLLPLLEKRFQPAVVKHLTTLADHAREDEAFFDSLLDAKMAAAVQKRGKEIRITPTELAGSEALSQRLVRRIVEDLKFPGAQLGAKHVEAVIEVARSGHSGHSLSLPGGVEVRRERDALLFVPRSNARVRAGRNAPREFAHSIDLARGSQDVRVPELRCVFRLRVIDWPSQRGETNKGESVLDSDSLRSPLVLRNWRPGDRLHPLGHRGAHKLKRLLNQKRVSRWDRDGWPVLTSGGVLVWARGFPVAAEYAATEKTRAGIVIAEEEI
jgi:tRNA(Ile)-lysidine synthase